MERHQLELAAKDQQLAHLTREVELFVHLLARSNSLLLFLFILHPA